MSKIKSRAALAVIVKKLKRRGKKVIFANGVFDIMHVGHTRFLKSAKTKGDCLIVGINSDSSTRKIKGRGRPIVPHKERAEILAAIDFVDYVTVFNEKTVDKTLTALRPAYHAKGTDYTKNTVPEKAISEKLGIKIVIVGDKKNHSTKDMIKDIIRKCKKK